MPRKCVAFGELAGPQPAPMHTAKDQPLLYIISVPLKPPEYKLVSAGAGLNFEENVSRRSRLRFSRQKDPRH